MNLNKDKTTLIALMLMTIACSLTYGAYHYENIGLFFIAVAMLFIATSLTITLVRSISVVFASIAISLAVAEFIGGYFVNDDIKAEYNVNSPTAIGYWRKTDVGSLANPGVHTSRKIAPDGKAIYDVVYTIGEDGFRKSHSVVSPKKRINFFGCSFMFGEGLNDDETLPFFVGKRMPNTYIKNYGFHGFGPHQTLAILQSPRDTTGDINFYLTAPIHIARSACKPSWTAGSPKFVMVGDDAVRAGNCYGDEHPTAVGKFLKYSNIYNLTTQVMTGSISDKDIELYLAIVKEISDISKSRNQKLIIGYIKSDKKIFKGTHYSNEKLYEALASMADSIVDLGLTKKNDSLAEKYFIHPLDKHPSSLANQKRAEMLSDVLLKY